MELQRHSNFLQVLIMKAMGYPAKLGAYTELFAGWSSEITLEKNGAYVIPWGRIGTYNSALRKAVLSKEQGGDGTAERFLEWCERETREYM